MDREPIVNLESEVEEDVEEQKKEGLLGLGEFGTGLPSKAREPARKFMYVQIALGATLAIASIVCVICAFIIIPQTQNVAEHLKTTPTNLKVPDIYHRLVVGMTWARVAGFIAVPLCFLIGCILFAWSRWALQSRKHLKRCVLFEKFCSCFTCCVWGSAFTVYFVILMGAAVWLSDSYQFCTDYVAPMNAPVAGEPYTLTKVQMQVCEEWVDLVVTPVRTTAIWLFLLSAFACLGAVLCGIGSRFADETHTNYTKGYDKDEQPKTTSDVEALPPLTTGQYYGEPSYSYMVPPLVPVTTSYAAPATTAYAYAAPATTATYAYAAPATTAYAAPMTYTAVAAPASIV